MNKSQEKLVKLEKEHKGSFEHAAKKMDWLCLEEDLRNALDAYKEQLYSGQVDEVEVTACKALKFISDAIGHHTGRGYVL